MRRKPRLRKAAEATRVPEVPVLRPDPGLDDAAQGPVPVPSDEDAVEDAVRRMVEAAYT